MTKERFMQIAEEVGIASSDWKEDLWTQHCDAVEGLTPSISEERLWAQTMILFEKEQGRKSYEKIRGLRRATRD